MRAFEIILFVILLQAAIVFTTDIGLFDDDYLEQSSLARNPYSTYTIEGNLTEYGNISENPSKWDEFKMGVGMLVEGLVMFVKIVFSIIFIYPVLKTVFGVPTALSALIQVGIYTIYVWGFMQYKSGKSTKYME